MDLSSVARRLGSDYDYYEPISNEDTDGDGHPDYRYANSARSVRASLHAESPERSHIDLGEIEGARFVAHIPHDQNVETGGILLIDDPNTGDVEPCKLTRAQPAFRNSFSRFVLVEAEADPRDDGSTGPGDDTDDDGFRVVE